MTEIVRTSEVVRVGGYSVERFSQRDQALGEFFPPFAKTEHTG